MIKKKLDMETLLNTSINLFRNNGFANTSLDTIAKACGIKKSSLYHYIDSREHLVNMAFDKVSGQFHRGIFLVAQDRELSIDDKLNRIASFLKKYFMEEGHSKFIINLAVEASNSCKDIADAIDGFFQTWIDSVASMLNDKYPEDKAQQIAEDLLVSLHGAALCSNNSENASSVHRVILRIEELAK